MPRLTTPQRAGFEKFRQRQQDRARRGMPGQDVDDLAGSDNIDPRTGKKVTPLGLDPVDPWSDEPIDLRTVVDGDGTPTPEQIAEANNDAEKMLRRQMPDGFGEGLDDLV